MHFTRTRDDSFPRPDEAPGHEEAMTPTATVDRVLWSLPRRATLTAAELDLAVAKVMVAVSDSEQAQRVAETFDEVLSRYDRGPVIDRLAVADALLDVRLLLGR